MIGGSRFFASLRMTKRMVKGKVLKEEPLCKYTSFQIGGPAKYLVFPWDLEDLEETLLWSKEEKIPYFILGGGSNILVKDKGFPGIVIHTGSLNRIEIKDNLIEVESGVKLSRLLSILQREGLSGLEFLIGIPGTIGGALIMNSGGEEEIGALVEEVTVLNEAGEKEKINRKELSFSYRSSNLKDYPFIWTAKLRLKKDEPENIRKRMKNYLMKKKESQPLSFPSAGSIFKNPEGKSSAELIEKSGCKGLIIGKAMVSKKHSNFIINLGGARALDVLSLISQIRKRVSQIFGMDLELEIEVVG